MTGYFTNIVRNILGHSHLMELRPGTGVAESGFLEILASYGFLGIISYYSVFILSFINIYFIRKEKFLGFVLLGAVIQTLFYQSIEVLPYIFTLSLIPLCANNIRQENPTLLSN